MKLQILIPHYNETGYIIKPLLDSLAIQQSIPMNELGVIICHDGLEAHDFKFTNNIEEIDDYTILNDYPFEIKQVRQEHKGVSAARNTALREATADYVMFCDIDDIFCNSCGLWIIFKEIEKGFDSLVSVFIEESRNPKTKDVEYINHNMDSTFVHGKVHRRKYLIENDIYFNNDLTIHEDSYFNILAQNLSLNVKYCPTAFYLWKWRDESVCRHDSKYILKTYCNMLDSNEALIKEFIKRGLKEKALFFVTTMIFDAYYLMNKPEWLDQENQNYRNITEKRFSNYFKKYKIMWNEVSNNDKMIISNQVRSRSVMEGMSMETITIDDWLAHIQTLGEENHDYN